MSVQNTIVKNVYVGNGVTTVFPYTFALNDSDARYIQVYVSSNGEDDILIPSTQYNVNTQAKTVTYPVAGTPLPSGSKIALIRSLPYTQELNLENQGPFFAEDVEAELDRAVMQIQQIAEEQKRCVKSSVTSDTVMSPVVISDLYAGRDAALAAAADAQASEVKAANHVSEAAGQVGLAKEEVANAKNHAGDARTYASNASSSASAAAQRVVEATAQTAEAEHQANISAANAQSAIDAMNEARGHAQAAADAQDMAETASAGAQHWAELANDYVEPLRNAILQSMFEYDSNADLQLVENPLTAASTKWEVDTDGDVMPAA